MNDAAIKVEGLSKAYRIGLAEQRHETLMGALISSLRSPFSNFQSLRKLSKFDDLRQGLHPNYLEPVVDRQTSVVPSQATPSDVIWALDDISFEIKHGEVLGVIGRNGAGKSTLLKILSRITEPTRGRAFVHGRVGSLLEVGTGFHPDLTGRENVYLNGTILGMKKKELDRKFDAIVAFSEVEKFIDTPVKRYSSGMRVRLAFAVAAHLDPEILVVDEVLAVGDLNFQRKCLGKMGEVAQQGRTVLFVSHNMAAVVQLCHRGIVLSGGKMTFEGTASRSVDYYVRNNTANKDESAKTNVSHGLADYRVNGSLSPTIAVGEGFEVSVTLYGRVDENLWFMLVAEDASGTRIFLDRWKAKTSSQLSSKHERAVRVTVPNLSLAPGMYSLLFGTTFVAAGKPRQLLSERMALEVRGDHEHLGRTLLIPRLVWYLEEK